MNTLPMDFLDNNIFNRIQDSTQQENGGKHPKQLYIIKQFNMHQLVKWYIISIFDPGKQIGKYYVIYMYVFLLNTHIHVLGSSIERYM